ncbi:precorrin-3B C(17)-methyltransferase [Prosthecochloris vibrioformis]|uniref:Precorrin-3B C(17)-methyltransferase n=1 Tax=Prosthecochloris vibrioformis TaxID=1098 RepID=A0A5C4S0D5_PROVB|nr:precorrin-3B C(17)-methyltransferase [Prosthecochloris vibrioformis]TNJ36890.1 precorrin-3B C(17)-methyltransferase [Prosthecochloris vibrioformis]
MKEGRIVVAGIGPGTVGMLTSDVREALMAADAVVGYTGYMQQIEAWIPEGVERYASGMTKEEERARLAFALALEGRIVVVVSSGDAGIYGMAPLMLELQAKEDAYKGIGMSVLPGISAFQVAAARLGAPVSHDFCVISLSDLMTPWRVIERRIEAAAAADFVTAVYNPASRGRYWQLHRLRELFMKSRPGSTPVGIARNAGRADETILRTTLEAFDPDTVDMFTVVLIGNASTFMSGERMITPRGYFSEERDRSVTVGQSIMIDSFRTIAGLMQRDDYPLDTRWAMIHTIHTTADFEFEDIFHASPGAIATWHRKLTAGGAVIVTDVSMVQSGLRKGALERYGITVYCYLSDPRVTQMAAAEGITRTQACMRIAAVEHPDALFVVGNAPTALTELADLMHRSSFSPMGVVGAPVGFVNVVESKLRLKAAAGSTPYVVIEGRKGGSSVAATIVNAAMSLDDAEAMKPGRDV